VPSTNPRENGPDSSPAGLPGIDAIRTLLREEHDRHGVKLLMCVARHNPSAAAITALIRAGAGVNDRDGDGRTALMYAAQHNSSPDVTRALLEAGADVDARDARGRTALILAAEANASPLVVSALLQAGADPGARDTYGVTAREAAFDNPREAVMSVLQSQGVETLAAFDEAPPGPRGTPASNNAIVAGFDGERDDRLSVTLQAVGGAADSLVLHLTGFLDTVNCPVFRARVMRG
jgi:ankyrin repeat protein